MTTERLIPTADAKEVLRLGNVMKKLLLNPEYLELVEITRKQIEVWTTMAMEPSGGNPYKTEYEKGVVYGIRLNLETPSRIIADANSILFRMENPNDRHSNPGPGSFNSQLDLFGVNRSAKSRDTPESISEQLGEPVGPDARVTADSN